MTEATYVVLEIEDRPSSGGLRSFGTQPGFGTRSIDGAAGMGASRAAPVKVKVSSEKMTEAQAADLRKNTRTLAERAFPIRLIKPMGDPVPAAADATAWGLAATMTDKSKFDGTGATVAVLDTGIDPAHPAFAHLGARLVRKDFTKDFTTDAEEAMDFHGHGTHCAGTIFGGTVGTTRIGIAPGVARALVAKVLPDDRAGDLGMLVRAMQWADAEKANIVSMSLGFDFPGMVAQLVDEGTPQTVAVSNALVLFTRNLRIFDRLMYLQNADTPMLVVAASGNESDRPNGVRISASLPAAADQVVVVGAYGRKGKSYEIASFSNTDVTLSAPGVGILSAGLGGGLTEMSGTSQACPHVAGLAALWWHKLTDSNQDPTAERLRQELFGNAKSVKFPPDTLSSDYGRGRAFAP